MPQISRSKSWHDPGRVKVCVMCGEGQPLSEFYSYSYVNGSGNAGTRYESRCKPCARARRRAKYQMNREHEIASHRAWTARNAEHLKEYRSEKQKDPEHRRNKAKAQRLRKARIRSGSEIICPKISALYEEAMALEVKAKDCPVFGIRELGSKFHVDHVVPLSAGGEHSIENLQILPAGINLRKGATCPE